MGTLIEFDKQYCIALLKTIQGKCEEEKRECAGELFNAGIDLCISIIQEEMDILRR